jgi:hypothetical protein
MFAHVIAIGLIHVFISSVAGSQWLSKDFSYPDIRHTAVAIIQLIQVRRVVARGSSELAGRELPAF